MVPSTIPGGAAASTAPLSEDRILACLAGYFPQAHPSLLLGRGDDCAVLKAERPLCVSSDLFLEDIHFRRSYFSPEDTGYKALAVNVSDLAGCGARPLAFTLCLGLPAWVEMDWLNRFFSGMAELAGKHRMALAGTCPAAQACTFPSPSGAKPRNPAAFLRAAAACRATFFFSSARWGWLA